MKARTLRLITALFVLLCFSFSTAYSQKYIIGPGEYNCFIIPTATHKLYDVAGGLPTLVAGQPSYVSAVAGALHHQCLLDNAGNCYCWGDNAYGEVGIGTVGGTVATPTLVGTDSLGNPFTNIVQVCPGASANGYEVMALKSDGTVWIWGATGAANRGNGTYGGTSSRPVQVPFPAGTVIKKVQVDLFAMALDANGKVWTWGGQTGYYPPYLLSQGLANPDPTTPKQISIPGTVVDIQGGSVFNYALCSDGSLYGWGYYANLLGLGANASAGLTPTLLNPILGFTKAIKQISINNESSFVLLADSTIWAWGDNACGTIGNGQELNFASYVNSSGVSAPYAWDWGVAELLQAKPVQIAVGLHSFIHISNGLGDVFYTYAEDVNGNLYSWGRNKGAVLGNAQMDATGDILSIYPNSFDVPWVTAVNPLGNTKVQTTSSPYCVLNPGGYPCNEYTIPSVAGPSASAGPNQNITTTSTTLTGSSTTANSNTFINYWLWTQVSGPSTALITLPSGQNATASNLVTGTYVFQLKVTDNNWRTSTSSVTVVVNNSNTNQAPVAKPNSKITLTLPTNSTTLTGTASYDPDGTIASYAWAQGSGPGTATIASPTAGSTAVSGLVQGTYIFNLTVTDNSGATNTAADTVVVNAATVYTPPTVSAGTDLTITLPVSTVTLNGTATGTNGATIATTSWTQTSGPSTATVVSVGNLITVVTGLVQGTYTFRLSATDNNGQTASSSVTVTVNSAAAAPPPTVSAGSSQTITLPANTATLTGTASGNGGATISSTQWTQTAGPSTATIGAAGNLSTGVSNLAQGTYTFTLTATDSKGQTASSTVTVTVNAAALVPPTVSAGSNKTITLPTNSVTLTGTATGNGGATIASTSWTQTGGPSASTIGAAGSLTTTVSNLVQGVYSFLLTATDNNGQASTSSVTVTVNAGAFVPPTVNAGTNKTITLPTNSVTLTGTATGNGGATIASASWTQTSGPSASTIGATGSLTTTVSNLVQGVYSFLLTATDNNGQTSTSSVTVTVNAAALVPPTVNAGSNQTITLPTNSVTLTGTATGNGGATISSTGWTQTGGPSTATIASAGNLTTGVSNLIQGTYTFLLTATDNNGQTTTSTMTVTVNSAAPPTTNTPPTVSAGTSQVITLPTNSVTVTGTAAGTNGATIASTQWKQIGGPTTATIVSAGSLSTTINGLSQGIYAFLLTATDNNGMTAGDYITVTVNAAPFSPPTVTAGSNQTITLPTNSATLTGTATATNGATIVSTAWSQISGPSTSTISAPSSLSTTVSGLVQGAYVFLLQATDNNGQGGWQVVTVTVNAASYSPPTVTAGSNQTITLPTNSVTLAGTATGTNGATIVSTVWSQVSGPSTATISTPSSLSTTVSGLVQGAYVFLLNATDNNGQGGWQVVTVTVNAAPANLPPTVSAGSNQTITLPTNSATITGTATGNNGASIVSTTWTQIGGPAAATIASSSTLTTTVSGLLQGTYAFLLTGVDNNGQSSSDYITVTVNPASNPVITPPNVSAGANQTITLPNNTVTLTGTATGTNGATIVSTVWSQVGGPVAVAVGSSTSLQASAWNLNVAGTYTFELTVTDSNGQVVSVTMTVTVNAAPPPPGLNPGVDQTITLPTNSVTTHGSAQGNAGATIVSTVWSQVSGPASAIIAEPGNLITAISGMSVAGVYTFQLAVTDNNGQTSTATMTVTVNLPTINIPPIANGGGDMTFTLAGKDTIVGLNGWGSYDPDGTIVSYDWYQLSGKGGVTISNSNTPGPTIYGLQTGVYVFVLVVTDNQGATSQAEVTITITAANSSNAGTSGLVVNAGKDTTIALPANTVQLSGSATSSAGGTISYAWTQVSGPAGMTLSQPDAAATQASNLVAGLYTFRLLATDQSGDTASATVKITVMSDTRTSAAVKDSSNEQFFLYPNPAHSQTTLNMTGDGSGTVMLSIFDMNGKFVKAQQFSKMPGTSSTTIDVSQLGAGMYIIRATYGNNQTSQIKLMKQ